MVPILILFSKKVLLIYIYLKIFFKDFIYLFLERGEGKEKEREKNINVWLPLTCLILGTWPATQACVLTGNRTGDPLVRRPALNPLSYSSQGKFTFISIPILSTPLNIF